MIFCPTRTKLQQNKPSLNSFKFVFFSNRKTKNIFNIASNFFKQLVFLNNQKPSLNIRWYGSTTKAYKKVLLQPDKKRKSKKKRTFFFILTQLKKKKRQKLFRRCKWRKSVLKRKWWDRRPPLPKKRLPLALEHYTKILKTCNLIYWKPKAKKKTKIVGPQKLQQGISNTIKQFPNLRLFKRLKKKQRVQSKVASLFFFKIIAYRKKYAKLQKFKGVVNSYITQKKYLPIRLQKTHKLKINYFYLQYYKFHTTYFAQTTKLRFLKTPLFFWKILQNTHPKVHLKKRIRQQYLQQFKLVQLTTSRLKKRFHKIYNQILLAQQAFFHLNMKQSFIRFFFKKRLHFLFKKHTYSFHKTKRLFLWSKTQKPSSLKLFQKYSSFWKPVKKISKRATKVIPKKRGASFANAPAKKYKVRLIQTPKPERVLQKKTRGRQSLPALKLQITKAFYLVAAIHSNEANKNFLFLISLCLKKKIIRRVRQTCLKIYKRVQKGLLPRFHRFAFIKKKNLQFYARYYSILKKRKKKIRKLQQLLQRRRKRWNSRRQRKTLRILKKLARKRARRKKKSKFRRKHKWKQRVGQRRKIKGRKHNSIILLKKLNNLHLNYLVKQKLSKKINTFKLSPPILKKFAHFFKNFLNVSTVQLFFKLKFFTMLNKQFRKNKFFFYKLATWLYKINTLKMLLQTSTNNCLQLKLLASKRFTRKVFTKSLKQRYFTRRFFTNHELLPIVLNCFFKRTSTYYLLAFIGLMLKKFKKHYQILTHINRFLIYFFKLTSSHAPITGLKYIIRGRVNGAPRKKNKIFSFGKVRSHTYKTTFDYTQLSRDTRYGTFGLKMWRYF